METRKPIVAGQFYPAGKGDCLSMIAQCADGQTLPETLPDNVVAAIVPHAGWVFSGDLAALALRAIKQTAGDIDTFVIFGAVHSSYIRRPAVWNAGFWKTPLGEIEVDSDLADRIVAGSGVVDIDKDSHRFEHSIEVQVPFVQHFFGQAKIVPVLVPPCDEAVQLGKDLAGVVSEYGKNVAVLASTDLTHYGPSYGFMPQGQGKAALKWAKEVNDMEFIDAAVNMQPEEMLGSASRNHNACGAGAAAAAVSMAKHMGVGKGRLLAHTHSCEVMKRSFASEAEDSVGYAAIVF